MPLFAEVPHARACDHCRRAADIELRDGEWLIHEGEARAFFILLSGRLCVSKSFGGIERVINEYACRHVLRRAALAARLAGHREPARGRRLRVARLDERDFRELIVACPKLNAELMRMMATRVGYLQQAALETPVATVTIIGHRFDLACHDLRDFLARNRVLFRWYDPRDPEARVGLAATPQADEVYPVVVLLTARG